MSLIFEPTSLSNNWAPWLSLLLDFAVKGTAIILAAGLLIVVLRRASAATRHLVLSLSIVSLLVLPALSAFLPAWQISILSTTSARDAASSSVPGSDSTSVVTAEAAPENDSISVVTAAAAPHARRSVEGRTPSDSSPTMIDGFSPAAASKVGASELGESKVDESPTAVNWSAVLLAIWLVGTFGVMVRLLIGTVRVWWLARNADPLTDEPWAELAESLSKSLGLDQPVTLLKSQRVAMPLTCGALRPAVLMPMDTFDWSHNRKQVVLKHELAHVKRRDCLTQMLANLVCAIYWFNPAVWLAARQLRIERERACDDCVLESGTRPSEYADHLLDLARSFGSARCSTFAAVAIAKRSQLEGRLLAILDPSVSRLRPNRAKSLLITITVVGLALPLGAIRFTARASESVRFETPESTSESALIRGDSRQAETIIARLLTQQADSLPAVAGEVREPQETGQAPEEATTSVDPQQTSEPDPSPGPSPDASAAPVPAPQDGQEKARAIESLRNALKDEDPQVRHQALMALAQLHDKSAVEGFKVAIKDKDPQVRAQAAWALGLNGDDSTPALLVEALRDESNQVRSQAAWGLGLKGDKSAVEPLIAALRDADENVRSQAAWALGLKGDSRSSEALAAALQDQSSHVRSQAAWALGLKGSKTAVEALMAALKDQDEHVRSQSAWALGLKGDSRAVDALIAALKDPSNQVRAQAAWALGLKGDRRAVDALSAAMKEGDQNVRRQAAWALGMILMRSGEPRGSDNEKEDENDNDNDNDTEDDTDGNNASVNITTPAAARIARKVTATTRARLVTKVTTEVTTTTKARAKRKDSRNDPPK